MKHSLKLYFKSLKRVRWTLLFYDIVLYIGVSLFLLRLPSSDMTWLNTLWHILLGLGCLLVFRFLFKTYNQIWRYGGAQSYFWLIIADACAFALCFTIQYLAPAFYRLHFREAVCVSSIHLLISLAIRLVYRYLYKRLNRHTKFGSFVVKMINFFGRTDWEGNYEEPVSKIRIAIVGAGRTGTGLAEELLNNAASSYQPICFIDIDKEKQGREIYGIPVIPDDGNTIFILKENLTQEVVFALPPTMSFEEKKNTYERYRFAGFKIKVYDYPTMQIAGKGKRTLREFDIEELLFRKELEVLNEPTINYYRDKVILITGGGGSIGSEIARQIAKMEPKQLILLDIYENGVYDVQQELKIAYGNVLDLEVEICSITNKAALEKVFQTYQPNIVIMAAAHKHVPLMEHNITEAIENNVFGTLITVELAEKYHADRVHLISSDKAVNPTNVMGATKRLCEMIVFSHSLINQHTTFSATRFGNVLGSAGSVVPLFKRQIANGGPVTLTDKRIERFFMTIPEASQLVLHSAAIAQNGELMVLDMGEPVKIYDLAISIIKLSGFEPGKDIAIKEIGLRPGEKLYEEPLMDKEHLKKTDNKRIFVEKDEPITVEKLLEALSSLEKALKEGDSFAKQKLKEVVPTYIEKS